ncbi:M20/M25/M40 family metallo-hydrolase [Bogoriella caseilytica]|uniref:Acetylornithine deacetylase/succinyl-diaminopimelate desuccinylase-like protein n=1 Tax=Bogoriella caseilytica TaxID=56055 RepID=A0A3N2B8Y9_9MICO|nr:M20/M25/M40 family metallo-hydrolase [Bogoriella caseilytica]ROR71746.1 acetylornithine deacetylase/succinyl-diaminopimelate desuccinylase-like protein [Bogoriella caseilytica]
MTDSPALRPEDEVAELCRDLIRIDTSNFGDGSGPGERAAAEYVMEKLTEVGFDPEYIESAPGRANVVLRIAGEDPSRPALVLHGHTDVVPAAADDWSVDPFAAEVKDGMIWGRGAVDMKDMDAMILAVVRDMGRTGWRPPRDLIVAFFADEEAGGKLGARYLVDNRPDLFEGASEAISEVGGFSVEIDGRRAYLLQTAEKGMAWLKLVADGTAGHGSQVNPDNAVTRLAGAVHRIGEHSWPMHLTKTVQQLLDGVAELTGTSYSAEDPESIGRLVDALGPAKKFVGATLRTGANPSQLDAGYKANVIPGRATATVDVRYPPGQEDATMATLAELAGEGVSIEDIHRDIALEVPFSGNLVDSMVAAIDAEDPGSVVLPYMLSGGTDNKSLSRLGVTGYGFAPLRLPPELDFAGMFHGVDERVPVEALHFGVRVLERLLRTS